MTDDATRQAVLRRDGFRCRHCGSSNWLSVDHVIPRDKGGTDEEGNLQTLCRPCNSRKGGRSQIDFGCVQCGFAQSFYYRGIADDLPDFHCPRCGSAMGIIGRDHRPLPKPTGRMDAWLARRRQQIWDGEAV